MKITKRQLKRLIREEKTRILREQDDLGPVDNNTHHWPRVDWSDTIGNLVDKWAKGEEEAFDTGDPSMNPEDSTVADNKKFWGDQVDNAAMDMEAELTKRVRKAALQIMKEFTDKLINGEYA
jgi:hypothetical protein